MTTIATLSKTDNGYVGELQTLSLNSRISLLPTPNAKGRVPEFQVIALEKDGTGIEIGGAWKRTSKNGNTYLSVRLDDPSFTAPVYANLIERDDQHVLIWNR
mgnify:FL=1